MYNKFREKWKIKVKDSGLILDMLLLRDVYWVYLESTY